VQVGCVKGRIEIEVRIEDGEKRTWAQFLATRSPGTGEPRLEVHWKDHHAPPSYGTPAVLGALLREAGTQMAARIVGFDVPLEASGPPTAPELMAAHARHLAATHVKDAALPAAPSFHDLEGYIPFWSAGGPGAAAGPASGWTYRTQFTVLPRPGSPEAIRLSVSPVDGIAFDLLRRVGTGPAAGYRVRPAVVSDSVLFLRLLLPSLGTHESATEGEGYLRRSWNIGFEVSTTQPPFGNPHAAPPPSVPGG